MNKEYKTFEELQEELGDKFEEYMYKSNIELLDKVNQLEQDKTAILLDGNSLINANEKMQSKITQLKMDKSRLAKKLNQLETNIDESIEILKLCDSQCSKETISILERGKE